MTVATEADSAQQRVGTLSGSDGGVVLGYSDECSVARMTHEWVAPGCESIRDAVPEMRRDVVPEVLYYFLEKRTVNASGPRLPSGFEKLNTQLYPRPVLSRIGVPI